MGVVTPVGVPRIIVRVPVFGDPDVDILVANCVLPTLGCRAAIPSGVWKIPLSTGPSAGGLAKGIVPPVIVGSVPDKE